MEKNGNTVQPGDRVQLGSDAVGDRDKLGHGRGTGKVKEATADGKVKVEWEDGTESFESPDELNRR